MQRAFILALCSLILGCPDTPITDRDRGHAAIQVTAPAPVELGSDDPSRVRFTLRFPDRVNHYVDVQAIFPVDESALELFMAVWTPGSYKVRDYSRHLESVTVSTLSGEPRDIVKVSKNRWRVATEGAKHVVVRYRVYSSDPSVRTNFVSDSIAVLNGAPTFMTIADDGPRSFDITIEMPDDWSKSVTALDPHPSGAPHRYVAPDYDTLVDSPIVIGNPGLYEFDIEGVPHILANFGEYELWDGPRSATDTEAIARAHAAFWGDLPYRRYIFLNVLTHDDGGLEHKASTLLMSSPFNTRGKAAYRRWLELVSHEFFHTWNIKRLRPKTLGPFDYESENYTRSLWIAEGITSYYDALMVRRANLIDDDEYLKRLSDEIESLQTKYPGRAVQPLSESSYDAWIKFYQPDENSRNTQVSYYNKGALVGFLLDAEIRRATQNRRSLDDVMRLAYQRYSGERGYTPEEFRGIASEVAGTSLDEFFARFVDGTDELDYGPALAFYGLRFVPESNDATDDDEQRPGYLGVEMDRSGSITRVLRDTPAYRAGLQVGDEILAIDEYRLPPGDLSKRLALYPPESDISILIARRQRLQRIDATLTEKPKKSWKLELDPQAGTLAASRRLSWLNGDRGGPSDIATEAASSP